MPTGWSISNSNEFLIAISAQLTVKMEVNMNNLAGEGSLIPDPVAAAPVQPVTLVTSNQEESGRHSTTEGVATVAALEAPPVAPEMAKGPYSSLKALNGSQRKRLAKLLKLGHDKKIAIELVRSTDGAPPKRQHSETSPEDTRKKQKTNRGLPDGSLAAPKDTPGPSYAEALKQTEMAICLSNYPETPLTTEQMDSILELLLDRVVLLEKAVDKPQFTTSTYKAGYITVACVDNTTVKWLEEFVKSCVPWEGAVLKVLADTEMPHPDRVVAYLPNGAKYMTDRIMDILEGMNGGFNFSAWRTLRRVNRKTNAMLVWAVDRASADHLAVVGHKLAFGFRCVPVRLKSEAQIEETEKLIDEMSALDVQSERE